MADALETPPVEEVKPEGFPDAAANNAEVKRKLEAQTLDKGIFEDGGSALDKLAEEKSKKAAAAAEETPVAEVSPKGDETPAPDAATIAKAAEEAAAKRDAEDAEAEKYFKDSPKLPPNASPKSGDAFRSVKIQAARDLAERDKQLEELKKQLAEVSEKAKNPLTPETEKEIKELREWRSKLDVEADPKFREFDKAISNSHEFIYAQLRKLPGVNEALIDTIKQYGGPDKTDMTKVWEQTKDPVTQRIVEAKIADIELAKFNKAEAIKATKQNIDQYLTERSKGFEQEATQHQGKTRDELTKLTTNLDWLKPRTEDAKMDDKAKAAVKAHNEFLAETNGQLEAALSDDSPQMRAIMLVGMANLFRLQKMLPAISARAETAEKALAEANKKLEGIKAASLSRLSQSSAPATSRLPEKKKDDYQFGVRAADSIDDLARDLIAKRTAATT